MEQLADPYGQLEAGGVIPALEKANGLVVDVKSIRQLLAREPAVSSQDSKPIVDACVGPRSVSLRPCHPQTIIA